MAGLNCINCQFLDGQAGSGGIYYLVDFAILNIKNSLVQNTIATIKASFGWLEGGGDGSIIENTNFYGNKVTGTGGMFMKNNRNPLTITNCQFINNVVEGGDNGLLLHASALTMTNCVFRIDSPKEAKADNTKGGYLSLEN